MTTGRNWSLRGMFRYGLMFAAMAPRTACEPNLVNSRSFVFQTWMELTKHEADAGEDHEQLTDWLCRADVCIIRQQAVGALADAYDEEDEES